MSNKKTYKDLNILVRSIDSVLNDSETKVQKKLKKLYEKVKKQYEEYQSQVEELRLDNAATDEKDILLTDEKGGYKFSKEGIKKLTKDLETLNEKEYDFAPINVINTNGLDTFVFLENWTTGITFIKEEEEEL